MVSQIRKAACHCGAVELELDLPNGIEGQRHCNCSLCRRKGAVMAYLPSDKLRIVKGEDTLRLYQFNTNTAKHYFCGTCGIYTHHHTRIDPGLVGYNVGCLEGVDPFTIDSVEISDGVNHPCDE